MDMDGQDGMDLLLVCKVLYATYSTVVGNSVYLGDEFLTGRMVMTRVLVLGTYLGTLGYSR